MPDTPDKGSAAGTRPESAYEGRTPPEPARTDTSHRGTPATGGVPESAERGTGPEADPTTVEKARESGGAPHERGRTKQAELEDRPRRGFAG